ncbi:MAG: MFS transporter [Methanomassiliicoccales archaeon]
MSSNAVQEEKLSLRGSGIILILLALIAMMVMFIEIMLVPALPSIAKEFPTEKEWISWVLSAYMLVGAVSTLILGRLGDIYGKKKILLVALGFYIAGLIGSAFCWSLASLIAFRAVQGVGMGMVSLAFGIVRDTFPRRLIPVAMGIISAMFSVGVSIGLLGGGWIVSNLSWRDCFYILAPLLTIMAIACAVLIKTDETRRPAKLDLPGTAMFAGGILSLLLGLTEGQSWGWTSAGILTLFALSAVLIIAFIFWEKRASSPIISLRLMANRGIAGTNVAAFFIGLVMFMTFQIMPYFLMAPAVVGGFGLTDAFMVGVYMLPSALAQLIFAPIAGKYSRRFGADNFLILGIGFMLLSSLMIIFLHTNLLEFLLAIFVMGIGMGLSMVSLINVITMSAPKRDFGAATGMNTLFRVVGGAIGPVLAAVIMANFTQMWQPPYLPVPVPITSEIGYMWVWGVGAIFSAIALVFCIIFRPGRGISFDHEVEEHEEKVVSEP